MFVVLLMIIEIANPNHYAVGISEAKFKTYEECQAHREILKKTKAPDGIELYTKCMTAEQAEKAFNDMPKDKRINAQ